MTRIIFLSFLLIYGFASSATERIRVAGSTTVLPIIEEAAKQYRQLHPDIVLTISGGGSGVGIAGIGQQSIEIGMASRQLTVKEKNRLNEKVELIPIARDAVAIAVSESVFNSGVKHLNLAQIAAIYRGEIKNWKLVGGKDSRILVIDKESSRGTRHIFAKVVLGHENARAAGATIITGSNNEEQAAISKSDKAIGMISRAWLNDKVRAVAIGDHVNLVLPTSANIKNGIYPISRDLNILVQKNTKPSVRAFVSFLRSTQGQNFAKDVGYLPIQ